MALSQETLQGGDRPRKRIKKERPPFGEIMRAAVLAGPVQAYVVQHDEVQRRAASARPSAWAKSSPGNSPRTAASARPDGLTAKERADQMGSQPREGFQSQLQNQSCGRPTRRQSHPPDGQRQSQLKMCRGIGHSRESSHASAYGASLQQLGMT